MKDQETAPQKKSETNEKPGFFKRIVDKVDTSMKKKADEKSQQSSCCGSEDSGGKGGKCC
jgi:hypothetical protein